MRPRWRKVLSDLIDNKARTLLVVFSIAVGVFSIGVIAGAYVIISNDMSVSYASHHPANLEIRTDDFDEDFLNTVRHFRVLEDAEGRRVVNLRARPLGEKKWTAIDVVAVQDFKKNKINLLTPVLGESIPEKDEILLEKDVLEDMNIAPGDTLEVELLDGTIKHLRVAGIVQDPTTSAADFLASPLAYVALDTLPTLGEPKTFNRLYATVKTGQDDDAHLRDALAEVKDKLERSGVSVYFSRRSKTHEHPLASTVNAILGILLALGILVLFLSSSLIANTMSALLHQHLRHIGVMKLLGGRNAQIFGMYLALIFAFSLLALAISVPLGGQGAYALSLFIADEMGFSLLGYRIVPISLIIQIAVGLLVPLIAGTLPLWNGLKITVLRAISGNALPETEGSPGFFERMQIKTTKSLAKRGIHLPRPILISLRNTFRHRKRLALTLFTLTMGGAIFISVFNVRVTLHDYVGKISNYFLADVTLEFDRPYRLRKVQQAVMQIPGVEAVEGWAYGNAEILYPDGSMADNINILAPPADSHLVSPIMVEGRWILPTDKKKLDISEGIWDIFPNLHSGDTIRLKINGKEETWEVVGIFKFVELEGILGYTPYEYLSHQRDLANRAYSFRIVTESHDRASQEAMAAKVDEYFRERKFHVRSTMAGLSTLDDASESLDILIAFLLIMALLTATVGSMGLAGTMGMNVLERTREIGIMRAIGATDRAVMRIVIVEGLLIGLISWVLAVALSFPITYMLSAIVSIAIFSTPIQVIFTPTGFLIWLALVIVLSALASVLPARNAARLTIREVLAYE